MTAQLIEFSISGKLNIGSMMVLVHLFLDSSIGMVFGLFQPISSPLNAEPLDVKGAVILHTLGKTLYVFFTRKNIRNCS